MCSAHVAICAPRPAWPVATPPADQCCNPRLYRMRQRPTPRTAQFCEPGSSWLLPLLSWRIPVIAGCATSAHATKAAFAPLIRCEQVQLVASQGGLRGAASSIELKYHLVQFERGREPILAYDLNHRLGRRHARSRGRGLILFRDGGNHVIATCVLRPAWPLSHLPRISAVASGLAEHGHHQLTALRSLVSVRIHGLPPFPALRARGFRGLPECSATGRVRPRCCRRCSPRSAPAACH